MYTSVQYWHTQKDKYYIRLINNRPLGKIIQESLLMRNWLIGSARIVMYFCLYFISARVFMASMATKGNHQLCRSQAPLSKTTKKTL